MATLMVLLVASVVGLALALAVNLRPGQTAPLDSEAQERWLVTHAPKSFRRALRYADRRFIGGSAVACVFAVVFLAALVVGWLFDTIDEDRGFARWDESAARWGSEHATSSSTAVFEAITQLGSTTWLLLTMAVIALADAWRRRTFVAAGYLAVVGIGILLLNNGLKLVIQRERPSVLALTSHHGWSFPSGHSAAAAACWAAIAFVVVRGSRRRTRAIAGAVAATVAIAVAASRVLLGVHWLTDVIAGAATGWAWFAVVTLVFGGRLLRLGEPAERVAAGRATAVSARERHDLEVTK